MAIPTRPLPRDLPQLARSRPWLRPPPAAARARRVGAAEVAVLMILAGLAGAVLTLAVQAW